MTLKPSNKPREFWLAGRSDGSYDAFEMPCGDYSGYYRATHVIEKSYADKLEKALAVLVEALQIIGTEIPESFATSEVETEQTKAAQRALAQVKEILEK